MGTGSATRTHGLSSSVGEVLPQQQTQLSGDSHDDVVPTSPSTLQLPYCKNQKETTNQNEDGSFQPKLLLSDKICMWKKKTKI